MRDKCIGTFGHFVPAEGAIPSSVNVIGRKQQLPPAVEDLHLKGNHILAKNGEVIIEIIAVRGEGCRMKEIRGRFGKGNGKWKKTAREAGRRSLIIKVG